MHTAWTQDATLLAAILATLLPFVAFVLIMVATRSCPRLSAGLSIAAVTVSLGCAVFLLVRALEPGKADSIYRAVARFRRH